MNNSSIYRALTVCPVCCTHALQGSSHLVLHYTLHGKGRLRGPPDDVSCRRSPTGEWQSWVCCRINDTISPKFTAIPLSVPLALQTTFLLPLSTALEFHGGDLLVTNSQILSETTCISPSFSGDTCIVHLSWGCCLLSLSTMRTSFHPLPLCPLELWQQPGLGLWWPLSLGLEPVCFSQKRV